MLQKHARRSNEVLRITGTPTYFKRELILTPGTVQQFRTTGTTSGGIIAMNGQSLWFSSSPQLLNFNPSTLAITPVDTPASAMQEIVNGPDGNVYYGTAATTGGGAGVGWANLSGNLGFVSTPGWVNNLLAASDGVWFTQNQGYNGIGYLSMTDHSTKLSPTTFGTVDPLMGDEIVWFGEFGPRIASVNAQGVVTEYTTKAAAISTPLAYDLVGNLWFGTDIALGYVTPDGAVVDVPIGGNGAFAILINDNGTIWFASSFSTQIGLLTVATGAVQMFNISGYPAGLVRGSDGNPWFTEYTDKIGTIDGGAVSEFATQGAQPYPPILGSDGNIWYGDGGDGSVLTKRYVGNVTPAGVVTEYLTTGLPNGLIQSGAWIYFGENAPYIGRTFVLGPVVK